MLSKAKSAAGKSVRSQPVGNRSFKNYSERKRLVQEFLNYREVSQDEKHQMSLVYPSKSFVDNVQGRSLVLEEGLQKTARVDVDPIFLLLSPVEYTQHIQAEDVRAGGTIPLAVIPEAQDEPDVLPPRITSLDCRDTYPVKFKSVAMQIDLTNTWLTDDTMKRDIQRQYQAVKASFGISFKKDLYQRCLATIPCLDIQQIEGADVPRTDIFCFIDKFNAPFDQLRMVVNNEMDQVIFVRHALLPLGGFDHLAVRAQVEYRKDEAISTNYQLRNQFAGTETTLDTKKIEPVGVCNGVSIFEEIGFATNLTSDLKKAAKGMCNCENEVVCEVRIDENIQTFYNFETRQMVTRDESTTGELTQFVVFKTAPVFVGDLSTPIGECILSPASSYFVNTTTGGLDPELRIVRQEAVAIHPTKLFPGAGVRQIKHGYVTSAKVYTDSDYPTSRTMIKLPVHYMSGISATGTAVMGKGPLVGMDITPELRKSFLAAMVRPMKMTTDESVRISLERRKAADLSRLEYSGIPYDQLREGARTVSGARIGESEEEN